MNNLNLSEKLKKAKEKALSSKKKRTVMRASTMDGGEMKSVERKSGKRVETLKKKDTGYKSRQVTGKDGEIKSTVTKTPGSREVERESKNRAVRKENYRKEGVKTKVVTNKKTGEKKYTFKKKGEKKIKGEAAKNLIEFESKVPMKYKTSNQAGPHKAGPHLKSRNSIKNRNEN